MLMRSIYAIIMCEQNKRNEKIVYEEEPRLLRLPP